MVAAGSFVVRCFLVAAAFAVAMAQVRTDKRVVYAPRVGGLSNPSDISKQLLGSADFSESYETMIEGGFTESGLVTASVEFSGSVTVNLGFGVTPKAIEEKDKRKTYTHVTRRLPDSSAKKGLVVSSQKNYDGVDAGCLGCAHPGERHAAEIGHEDLREPRDARA
jgi:hypothetical protein